MLKVIIPLVFLALGAGGGIAAGFLLGGDDAPEMAGAAPQDGDGTDPGAMPAAADDISETPEEDMLPSSGGATEFVRLNNQFVVPIVHQGSVRSLVVIALTIEVPLGENGAVFDREPRLRDAFLRAMFAHGNAGGFDGSFTEASAMAPLRRSLREAAQRVLGETAVDVLIVDITRQDA